MRIFGGRVGLAAVVMLGHLPLVISADAQRVNFFKGFDDGIEVAGQRSAIYTVSPSVTSSRTFFWSIAPGDDLQVNTVNLFVINGTRHDQIGSSNQNGSGQDGGTPATVTSSTRPGRPTTFPPLPGKRAETGLQGSLKVESNSRSGSVTVDSFQSLLTFHGLVMYFEAVWPENDGRSYSRAFTVIDQANPGEAQSLADASRFTDPTPVLPQNGGNGVGIATETSTSIPEATGGVSVDSSFSKGAIAGIAVGGFVALLLICAAVWFFCIRRRGQANDEATLGSYGNARTRTDELIAEKEANAGADVSPHSPYSDDGGGVIGGRRGSSSLHNINPAAIPPVTSHHRELSQQQLKQYTPYSDHPNGEVGLPAGDHASRGGSPIPGRTTPHGLSATPYAHLVEEGMTEDEIRRLEEEERALDAAIEQAGRRP